MMLQGEIQASTFFFLSLFYETTGGTGELSVLSPCNVCPPANEGIFRARRENYLSASKREFCKNTVLGLHARTGTPKPKQLCCQLEAQQCIFSLNFRSCSLSWKFPFRFGKLGSNFPRAAPKCPQLLSTW